MIKRSHALLAGSCALFGACHLVNGLDGYSFDGGGGGGHGGAGGGEAGAGGESASVAVSVEVVRLSTELSLSLNGDETLPVITADGTYAFETRLANGASYTIAFDDPVGEACEADLPSGTVDGTDVMVTVTCTPVVRPLYPDAPSWLDYTNAAGDGPCETGTATRYTDCRHGGERRAVYVPGAADCAALESVATDSLGAFDWSCDDSGPYVELSSSLKTEIGLIDLIDFSAQSFAENSVVIPAPSGDITTAPAVWWDNPFAVADETTTHDEAGTIYLVLDDPLTGLSVDGDRVALVVQDETSVTPSAGPSLTATGVDFVWLEGDVAQGVGVSDTTFAVMRNMVFQGDASLESNTAMLVHDVEIYDGSICLDADGNTGLAVEHAAFHGCGRPARFLNGTGGYLREVVASDCQGALLIGMADGFAVDRVTLSGFVMATLIAQNSSSVHMTRIIAAATDNDAIRLDCTDCSLRGATAVLASGRGFFLSGTGLWLSNLLAADNGLGIDAENLTTRGRNWVSVRNNHAVEAINLEVSDSAVILDGVVKLGGSDTNCSVVNATGIEPGATCLKADASTFILSTPANGATNGIFGGKVLLDDGSNGSDTAGSASYDTITDWVRFERETRAWGINGSNFPNIDHQGRCSTTNSDCRIWDWALRSSNAVALDQNGVPSGDDVGTVGGETFLLNAIELLGDGVGDDDNLCESNEACGYMPNIGGYQGHGKVMKLPELTGGAITGVTLYGYVQNGA